MSDLMTIELKDLRFNAFHGVHPEEKEIGSEFEVNLSVGYIPNSTLITSLSNSINYVELFQILQTQMQQPNELLETLAQKIAAHIRMQFSQVKSININITKLNPPIATMQGKVGVNWQANY